ncbi:DNA/RNA non-specific endonuclease [Moraxella caprae]|uniref:DNA/RNA non-specific endonuclease n=1 Tax=Moraxella caprae TaxID=90240 RepID=UPI001583777B|nr:DNA/RNA non-specific endonuclease [Moraxella caprae]
MHNKNCWYNIPADAKKTQIGNDTVYEFEDNGRTVKVIENPEFSQKGGAQFLEVKVTGRGNKQKVTIIKENKPNITRDVNSDTIVVQQGEKGNWNQYLNKPEPNKRIVIEETGHIYHTDSLSRVSLVEADLRKHENDRNTNQQCKSGGCDRLPTDHGGHLIASMFDGLGEGINIVPMDAKFNGVKGRWYEMEKEWKKTLENNGTVQVKIEPIYSGNSKRPDFFMIHQTINGKKSDPILLENKAKPTEE